MDAGRRVGVYEIGGLLGAGGMGEVYRARDTKLGRAVAIKFLPRDSERDPDRLRRFTNEARAASALNHPNILTVHEIGEADGRPFIAMELIEGQTLRERLRSGPLTLAEALDLARQVAVALAAAHEKGVVHGDIKPENVMLRPDGYAKSTRFRSRDAASGT
jgi:serine/threonine protein kinase